MKSSKRARVLLDTSTLFSALGWSGAPFEVLIKINEGNSDLVLTDYILDELSDHFRDFPPERRKHALKSLEHLEEASVVEESEWKENLSRAEELVGESKDAPIMAAFLTKRVDVSSPATRATSQWRIWKTSRLQQSSSKNSRRYTRGLKTFSS